MAERAGRWCRCGLQAIVVVGLAVWWGNPVGYVLAFLLMGRTQAQLAALMHEAAHRLLFANRRANDFVGRWFLGYPSFTSTDAYRRVHMAHHRQEFGPDEPDIPLYAGYPISRRELPAQARARRHRTNRVQAVPRPVRRVPLARRAGAPHALEDPARSRPCCSPRPIVGGVWWVYPVFWVAPFLTVWRVINRLRSIAEHGGMDASPDRRAPPRTPSASRGGPARVLVPFHIGWHLAHHVDAGVSMRHLPEYHRALVDGGYVTPALEYPGYRALWRALRAGTRRIARLRVRKVRAWSTGSRTRGVWSSSSSPSSTCAVLLAIEPGDGFPTGVSCVVGWRLHRDAPRHHRAGRSTTTTFARPTIQEGTTDTANTAVPAAAAERTRLRRRHPGRELRADHEGPGRSSSRTDKKITPGRRGRERGHVGRR